MNKIAIVDLATRTVGVEEIPRDLRRRFLGGRGINTRLLFGAVDAGTDPLGPDNVLLFGAGLLTGLPWVGASRSNFTAKSPETGHLGDSAGGGHFGAEVRFAGFDHLVLRNRADRPIYLWVHDGTIEFRDAGHLEPRTLMDTQDAIKRELGDPRVQVAAIGPGGRRLVRWACVMHTMADAWGRTGMGAVMGSKNLWAIAARGTGAIPVADATRMQAITRAHYEQITRSKGFLATSTYGTLVRLNNTRTQGYEGGFNHQRNMTELPGELDADVFLDRYEVAKTACFNCPTHCRHLHEVTLRDGTRKRGGGPEYGGVGGWGSQCGSSDWRTILEAWDYCNEMGLDTLSATAYTAWLMELYEKGVITEADTDGLALRWGDHDAIMGVLRQTVERRGIGALIADGWMHAAREIGRGAERFFDHVKGLSIECDDVRGHRAQVLGLATSSRGACHLRSRYTLEEFSLPEKVTEKLIGVPIPSDPTSYERKEHACVWTENLCALADALGACKFLSKWLSTGLLGADEFRDAVEAATGLGFTTDELVQVGDRIYNTERLFLVRQGISRKDDALPWKFYEPWTHGPRAGTRVEPAPFEALLDRYYALRGWDEHGIPTPETLRALGLENEAAFLGDRREVQSLSRNRVIEPRPGSPGARASAGGLGGPVEAPHVLSSSGTEPPRRDRPMLRLTVNKSLCTGCRFCESVCASGHGSEFSPSRARVRIRHDAIAELSFNVHVCRQCSVCPPLSACPTSALARDPDTGILHLDPARCPSRCRLCAEACHLGAFHDGSDGLSLCDLCGGDPACVKVCYTEALFPSEYRLTARGMGKRAAEPSAR